MFLGRRGDYREANLGNLIREFHDLSFPPVLAFSDWPAQFPQICSILSSHEHKIMNGGGERLRRKIQETGGKQEKDEGDQKGLFLISQFGQSGCSQNS